MELEKMKKQELIAEVQRLTQEVENLRKDYEKVAEKFHEGMKNIDGSAMSFWEDFYHNRFICHECRSALSIVKTKRPFCPSCGKEMNL